MISLIGIPRFQLRLKVWDFVNSFEEKLLHVAEDVKGISKGCECLLSSMRMRSGPFPIIYFMLYIVILYYIILYYNIIYYMITILS